MSGLRASAAAWVAAGTPTVAAFQRLCGVTEKGPTNALLHACFTLGAALGNELFFITFLPWVFWEYDWAVGRRIVHLWASSYYLGQLAKDLLQLPRPPPAVVLGQADDRADHSHTNSASGAGRSSAGHTNGTSHDHDDTDGHKAGTGPSAFQAGRAVVRLERHYETEYGMPSTHAMNAVAMPGALLLLSTGWPSGSITGWPSSGTGTTGLMTVLQSLLPSVMSSGAGAATALPSHYAPRFEGSHALLATVCASWCLLCTTSRLYVGVHSPADIITGLALGTACLAFHLAYGAILDWWLLTSPAAGLVIPLLAIVATAAYPRPSKPRWVSSPGDTTIIVGVWAGVSLGARVFASQHVDQLGLARLGLGIASGSGTDNLSAAGLASESSADGRPFGAFPPHQLSTMPARLLLGFLVLVLTRAVVKGLGMAVVTRVVDGVWGREYEQTAEASGAVSQDSTDSRPGVINGSTANGSTATSSTVRRRPHVSLQYDSSSSGSTGAADETAAASLGHVGSSGSLGEPTAGSSGHGHGHSHGDGGSCGHGHTNGFSSRSTSPASAAPVPVPPSRRYATELPVKLLTYGAVGYQALVTVPLMFQWLHGLNSGSGTQQAATAGADGLLQHLLAVLARLQLGRDYGLQ